MTSWAAGFPITDTTATVNMILSDVIRCVTTSTATTPAVTPTTPTTVVWILWISTGKSVATALSSTTYIDNFIIYYYDGDSEYLYYGYDRNGDLIMATDPHFYQYTAYCPAGYYYYSQAKDVVTDSDTATTKAKEGTSTAPKGPRATKAREALVEK